jgi:hypothetical protein
VARGGGGRVVPAPHVLRRWRFGLGGGPRALVGARRPRFSLDGRDAMYRASFSGYYDGLGHGPAHRDSAIGGGPARRPRASAACGYGMMDLERMPATVAGESVVWCKPGVVAKLMGLDAVPVPVRGGLRRRKPSATCVGGVRKQQRLSR